MQSKIKRDIISFAKPYGYIYKIENLINGKKYIGLTTNKKGTRWRGNFDTIKCSYLNSHLISSLKKYGINNFEVKIIDSARNKDELDEKEEYYIQKYNTLKREYGYNHRHGGSRGKLTEETKKKLSKKLKGRKFSEETKRKMSERMKRENNPMYNINHSEETKIKISETIKKQYKDGRVVHTYGKHLSKETKLKISKALQGRKLSEETKIKIGEAGKGRKFSEESIKKMTKFHLSKKYLEKQYLKLKKSTTQIAKENGCSYTTIRKKLNNFNIQIRSHSEAQKLYKNGVKNK